MHKLSTKLVAKNEGLIQVHHFADASETEIEQRGCSWGLETELHLLSKEVIEKSKQLIPPIGINEPIKGKFTFESVILEKLLNQPKESEI